MNIKNFDIRSNVTKFRLSNHRLTIETGRHTTPKTPKEERFCPFCPGKVEDEYHFLFECRILRHLRQECFEKVVENMPIFENLQKETRINTLMCEIGYDVCNYIRDGMELRNFLASHPRTFD